MSVSCVIDCIGQPVVVGVSLYVLSISSLSEADMVREEDKFTVSEKAITVQTVNRVDPDLGQICDGWI